jgi:hypothetical protein
MGGARSPTFGQYYQQQYRCEFAFRCFHGDEERDVIPFKGESGDQWSLLGKWE